MPVQHDGDQRCPAPGAVNLEEFFGITNWQVLNVGVNQNAKNGSYNFGAVYGDMLLIFKNGKAQASSATRSPRTRALGRARSRTRPLRASNR